MDTERAEKTQGVSNSATTLPLTRAAEKDGDQAVPDQATFESPYDWPKRRKWVNVCLISFQGTLSPVCSTILAVGAHQVDSDFDVTSLALSAVPVAVFVLGLGLGPLYLAPLSDVREEKRVHHLVWLVLALQCRVIGGQDPSLGGGSIGDMFKREERGGGVIGYIAQNAGWRWMMWTIAISSGFTTLISVFFLRETYGPYLAARAQGKRSAAATVGFAKGITRPVRMFFTAPIVTAMSLYMALIYGILYLHFVTIPLLFGPTPHFGLFTYAWQHGNEGLAYLGAGMFLRLHARCPGCRIRCGMLTVALFCLFTLNRSYRALSRKYGEHKPEFRMLFMQIGMVFVPIGLFIFGWTAQNQTHWALPMLGAAIFAFGMLIAYICVQTYLVDSFPEYAASALAAAIILRSCFPAPFQHSRCGIVREPGLRLGDQPFGLRLSCDIADTGTVLEIRTRTQGKGFCWLNA
ncbi:unnamed protein product [Mycena citricolor]|uniref:MFS general substrate transporter n=1 Tax=Mycena citricolor TaxID=2018698 RepID=A0AAD2HYS0_9AGAR|nr:unnamed protein product [Mycena citricolor]